MKFRISHESGQSLTLYSLAVLLEQRQRMVMVSSGDESVVRIFDPTNKHLAAQKGKFIVLFPSEMSVEEIAQCKAWDEIRKTEDTPCEFDPTWFQPADEKPASKAPVKRVSTKKEKLGLADGKPVIEPKKRGKKPKIANALEKTPAAGKDVVAKAVTNNDGIMAKKRGPKPKAIAAESGNK